MLFFLFVLCLEAYTHWKRTKNVEVTVGRTPDELDEAKSLCYYHGGILSKYYTTLTCDQPIRGQFVRIQLKAHIMLNLYEIEVHGL